MTTIEGQPSLFIQDLNGKEYPAIAEVKRNKRVNGQRELTLSFYFHEINEDFIHDIEFGWKIYFKGEWYTTTTPSYYLDGQKFSVGVSAVLSFFVDMNGHYLQDEVEDQSMTPANFFRELFEGTGYSYVLVDNLSANTLNYQANQSKTERFLYGIDRFEGEYTIRGKVAYIYALTGSDKNVILHEDLNVQDASVEVDGSGFHTWAKGFGDKDSDEDDYNLEVEYVSPLVEKYGYIEGPAIRDGSYKHADALTEAVKKQAENSYKVSTTITAVDLTNNGYPEMQFEEGDRVFLYVDRLKLNTQVRVVEIEETFDWEGNIIDVSYTLGNEGIAKRYKTQQYNAVSDFRDIQNGRKKIQTSWLDDAIRRASDIINGNLTSHFEYGVGEIIGINTDNPNGYMRFNTDGLGFSRDGGRTYRTAITYEGIVADAITAGTLRSILIESIEMYSSYIEASDIVGTDIRASTFTGGMLESENGNLVMDLNNRRFHFYEDSLIRFHNGYNQLYRRNGNNAASVSFPTSMDTDIPMMVVGTDPSGGIVDANSPDFTGLRVHSVNAPHATNLVARGIFYLLDRSDHENGGYVFQTGYVDDVSRAIYPYRRGNTWTYTLGRNTSSGRWTDIYLENSPNVNSDERLKKDIEDNILGLDFLLDFRTVAFRLTTQEDGRKQFGIIAQQLIEVLQKYGIDIDDIDMVTTGEDGYYGVRKEELIAPIIKAIQELYEEVEELKYERTA